MSTPTVSTVPCLPRATRWVLLFWRKQKSTSIVLLKLHKYPMFPDHTHPFLCSLLFIYWQASFQQSVPLSSSPLSHNGIGLTQVVNLYTDLLPEDMKHMTSCTEESVSTFWPLQFNNIFFFKHIHMALY